MPAGREKKNQGSCWGSNPGPPAWAAGALTTELRLLTAVGMAVYCVCNITKEHGQLSMRLSKQFSITGALLATYTLRMWADNSQLHLLWSRLDKSEIPIQTQIQSISRSSICIADLTSIILLPYLFYYLVCVLALSVGKINNSRFDKCLLLSNLTRQNVAIMMEPLIATCTCSNKPGIWFQPIAFHQLFGKYCTT